MIRGVEIGVIRPVIRFNKVQVRRVWTFYE